MSIAMYELIHRYVVTAVCEQPMHVGSADGEREDILRHPTMGQPFIQASGIAGVMADYVQKAYGENTRIDLFGGVKQIEKSEEKENQKNDRRVEVKSKVVVLDGRFVTGTVKLEMRTRCSLNGATGSVNKKEVIGSDADSGQLRAAEYIGCGSEFNFVVLVYGEGYQKVEEVFAAINAGKIYFGGQNTIGFGKVSLKEIRVSAYNMKEEGDRKKWKEVTDLYQEDGKSETENITKLANELPGKEYCITFDAALNTALLIKANMVDEERIIKSLGEMEQMPDFMNIINAKKEYIIPGSSLKGVFRSRMETIGKYLDLPKEWLEEIFEQRSKILFEDTVICRDRSYEKKRIHLNKISGSTKYKALFSECVTGGRAEISIYIDTLRLEQSSEAGLSPKACIALLLYVIRDLALGAVTLGSGTSIGRGLVEVERVQIQESSEKKADFILEEGKDVESDFVAECLKELEKAYIRVKKQEA